MITKLALTTVAAAALCVPAMAPAVSAGPSGAVANVAYSVPASFGDLALPSKKKHHDDDCNGGINVCGNSVQAPVQACGNNILNNISIGILGRASSKGGNNSSKCSQKTSSSH